MEFNLGKSLSLDLDSYVFLFFYFVVQDNLWILEWSQACNYKVN